MNKIKSLTVVALAILIGGILSIAAGQRRMLPVPVIEPPVIEPLSGSYKLQVIANDLSTGDTEFTTGATYGRTAYGTTEGALPGFVFISMNYSSPTLSPLGTATSIVSGGSWSKLIFINGEYTGSVYGKIVGGKVAWSENRGDLTATISLQLTSDGGTELYAASYGSGSFEGILDPNSKGSTVSGTLILYY